MELGFQRTASWLWLSMQNSYGLLAITSAWIHRPGLRSVMMLVFFFHTICAFLFLNFHCARMTGKQRLLLLSATKTGLPMYEAWEPLYISLPLILFFCFNHICALLGKRPSKGKRKSDDKGKSGPKMKKQKTAATALCSGPTIINIDDEDDILPQLQGSLPTAAAATPTSTGSTMSL